MLLYYRQQGQAGSSLMMAQRPGLKLLGCSRASWVQLLDPEFFKRFP